MPKGQPGSYKKKTKTRKTGDNRNPHAVALGARGASKGGKARAAKMTPRKRSQVARKGGKAGGRGRSS